MKTTFIITPKNGDRFQYISSYNETSEEEIDAAWDEVYAQFPDAEHIERF